MNYSARGVHGERLSSISTKGSLTPPSPPDAGDGARTKKHSARFTRHTVVCVVSRRRRKHRTSSDLGGGCAVSAVSRLPSGPLALIVYRYRPYALGVRGWGHEAKHPSRDNDFSLPSRHQKARETIWDAARQPRERSTRRMRRRRCGGRRGRRRCVRACVSTSDSAPPLRSF